MRGTSVPKSISVLGPWHAARYWTQLIRAQLARDQRLFTLRLPGYEHPIAFRANTSDRYVIYQIFLGQDYAPVLEFGDIRLIVDCGANAGYSSVYFLRHFPSATLIALEPDPETHAVLTRNLQPYGDRAVARNVAVWSHPAALKLTDTFFDGEAWARQVREAGPGETPDLEATDIPSLLRESGFDRISLLKIDIEGAEAVVLADAPWLEQVDNLVIELHGEQAGFGDCEAVFNRAIAGHNYRVWRDGENTFCRSAED